MADEKILKEEELSQDQLNEVAGGTRAEFNEICQLLGKSPTFNTRDGIRNLVKKNYHIDVAHWNTGDWGSAKNAPAEFYAVPFADKSDKYPLTFDQVKAVISGKADILEFAPVEEY